MAPTNDASHALDSAEPVDNQCLWWKLPRELRDEILKISCSRLSCQPLKVLAKFQWNNKQAGLQRSCRRHHHIFTPTPFNHYVDRFLVNKQYATEAHTAFISTTHFDFAGCHDPMRLRIGNILRRSFRELTVLTTSVWSLVMNADNIATYLPQLKNLHVIAERDAFDSVAGSGKVDIMSDKVSEASVHKMRWFANFALIRGLHQVSFSDMWTPTYEIGSVAATNEQRMSDNIEIIKATITKSLKRPKVVQETGSKMVKTRSKSIVDLGPALVSEAAVVMDKDIPDTHAEILKLMRRNPDGFAAWAHSASKRTKLCEAEMAKSELSTNE